MNEPVSDSVSSDLLSNLGTAVPELVTDCHITDCPEPLWFKTILVVLFFFVISPQFEQNVEETACFYSANWGQFNGTRGCNSNRAHPYAGEVVLAIGSSPRSGMDRV